MPIQKIKIPFAEELKTSENEIVKNYVKDGIFLILKPYETLTIEGSPKNYTGIILAEGSRLNIKCTLGTEEYPVLFCYQAENARIHLHKDSILYYDTYAGISAINVDDEEDKEYYVKELYGITTDDEEGVYLKPCAEKKEISEWWELNVNKQTAHIPSHAKDITHLLHITHATPCMALLNIIGINIKDSFDEIVNSPFDSNFADIIYFEEWAGEISPMGSM